MCTYMDINEYIMICNNITKYIICNIIRYNNKYIYIYIYVVDIMNEKHVDIQIHTLPIELMPASQPTTVGSSPGCVQQRCSPGRAALLSVLLLLP